MDENWYLENVEIRGGFLNELDLRLARGLTCIIGPRGSGKSTLAEAIRFGVGGLANASKPRTDIFKGNLSKSIVTITAKMAADGQTYVIRREGRDNAILTTSDGRALSSIDLDRGTFLPLDGYSSFEIEEIAEERLGGKRRSLFDELQPDAMQAASDRLAEARRALEANADQVRAARRQVQSANEQMQALAGAPDRLARLTPVSGAAEDTATLQLAARQDQLNKQETSAVAGLKTSLRYLSTETQQLSRTFGDRLGQRVTNGSSSNTDVTTDIDRLVGNLLTAATTALSTLALSAERTLGELDPLEKRLAEAHLQQDACYAGLREKNQVVGQAVRERTEAEEGVRRLEQLRQELATAKSQESAALESRKGLRSRYVQLRDVISGLRDQTAKRLVDEAGENVRIKVWRNADKLEYQQEISQRLHGASVRNHDSIVDAVTRLRPDELAQLLTLKDQAEFESICQLGGDRSSRVFEALRSSIDPLALEVLQLDDSISIELNVGSGDRPVFKDASDLSRGQKCTALLPLLLARRNSPLIIDQPEDNLDNHFIFRTVVESVQRLKTQRQMVFITHNANIPVLAEADLIVVMGSDGKVGYIEKQGTVDNCRTEIIDLLEGGREAFDKRRERYAR
ncbi:MAG: AAA family ATPase [Capsulimonadaceae bacterium]